MISRFLAKNGIFTIKTAEKRIFTPKKRKKDGFMFFFVRRKLSL